MRNTFSQKGELERLRPLESNKILPDGEADKKERHVNNVEVSSPRASAKGVFWLSRGEHWEVTYIWATVILGSLQRKTRSGLASTLTTGDFWKWAFSIFLKPDRYVLN